MKTTTTNLLLVCLSLLVASSLAQPQYQIDALMDFYNSTSGGTWAVKYNWGTGLPCQDKWYGLTCDDNNESIIKMDLSTNKLVGTIPESFGQLSSLNQVYLSGNALSAPLPQSLTNLTSLVALSLNTNSISGTFPEVILSITSLQYLDLGGNSLTGQIPDKFDSMTPLTTLFLYTNQFTGSVPPTILNNLNNCDINLGLNNLTSIPWDQWTNSQGLSNSSLDLSSCQFSGSLSDKIYWPSKIFLSNNAFSGTLPDLDDSNGIPPITSLAVGSNQLTGNLPVSLTKATNVTYIYVSINPDMSGEIPVEYASMPNLQNLYFTQTGLTCPKDNDQWDKFENSASTSCIVDSSSPDSHLGLYIGLGVGSVVLLLIVAGVIVFFVVRRRRSNFETIA